MISKIIQKEKERQEKHLSCVTPKDPCIACITRQVEHKQSLINLKEYLEEEVNSITGLIGDPGSFYEKSRDVSNDIDELTKMIERYE